MSLLFERWLSESESLLGSLGGPGAPLLAAFRKLWLPLMERLVLSGGARLLGSDSDPCYFVQSLCFGESGTWPTGFGIIRVIFCSIVSVANIPPVASQRTQRCISCQRNHCRRCSVHRGRVVSGKRQRNIPGHPIRNRTRESCP